MPIQFRCQYCQQLLGISRSRAGSMVDCPACGRSLRVPAEDGTPAKVTNSRKVQADTRLLNALAELSGLGELSTAPEPTPPSTTPQPRSPKLTLAPPVSPRPTHSSADQMRLVPLKPGTSDAFEELAGIPADDVPDDALELAEPELLDEPTAQETRDSTSPPSSTKPDSLQQALQELTSLPPVNASIPPVVPVRRQSVLSLWMIPIITGAVAFVAGYQTATFRAVGSTATQKPATPDNASAAESPAPAKDAPAPVIVAEPGSLRGTVKYRNAAGEFVPDDDALVLLVPSKNSTQLKLDGRPLREDSQSVARRSIEAALDVLQISVTRVSADGTFSLPQKHKETQRLVVISRHKSRTDGESVAGDAQQTLTEWFESTSHLVGRLAAKVTAIDAPGTGSSPAVNVTFE